MHVPGKPVQAEVLGLWVQDPVLQLIQRSPWQFYVLSWKQLLLPERQNHLIKMIFFIWFVS